MTETVLISGVDVHESVSGRRRVIAGLFPEQSGGFLDYRGEIIPW